MDRDRKRKAYLKAIAGGVIRPDVYEMMKAQNQTQGDPEKRRVRKRQYDRNSKKRMKKLVKVMKVWSQILVWWVQYRNRYPEGIYSTWQEEEGDPAVPLPHGWVPDKNTLDAVLAEENPDDADNSLTWAEIGEKRPAIFTAQPGRYGQSPTLLSRKEMCIRVYHAVSADLYEWMESSPPGYEVHGCYNPAGRWNRPCLRHQGHGGGCQHHPGIFPKEGRDSIDGHLVTRDDLDEFLKMADSKRFERGFRSKRAEIYDWFKKRYKDYDEPFVPYAGPWSKIALALLGLFILAPGEDEEEGEQPEESDYNDDEGDWEKQFGDDEDDDDEYRSGRDRKSQRTQYDYRNSWRSSGWQGSGGARNSDDAWRGWSGGRWANSGAAPVWVDEKDRNRYLDRCHPCAIQEIDREDRNRAEARCTVSQGSSPVKAYQMKCRPCSPVQGGGSSIEGAGHVNTLSVQPHEWVPSGAGAAEKSSDVVTLRSLSGPSTLVPRVFPGSRALLVNKRVNDVTAEVLCAIAGNGLWRGPNTLAEFFEAVYAPRKKVRVERLGLPKSSSGRGDREAEAELPPRKLRRRASPASSSLVLRGSLLALMPLMVQGMDLAVVGQSTTSALGLMSLAATIAWYVGSGSAVYSIAIAVPDVIDTGVRHIEGVVSEVTDGSRLLIRNTFVALIAIVLTAIMIWGSYLLSKVYVHCFPKSKKGRRSSDEHSRKYGGRLHGGAGQMTAQQVLARVGIVGDSDPVPVVPRSGQVDLNRLTLGDVVSFLYHRGRRSGQRRNGIVISFPIAPTGMKFEIEERIQEGWPDSGSVVCRQYWPSATSGVIYSVQNIFRERANMAGAASVEVCAETMNVAAAEVAEQLASRQGPPSGDREGFVSPESRSDALEDFQANELVRITARENARAPASGGLALEDVPAFPDLSSQQKALIHQDHYEKEDSKRKPSSALKRAESAKELRGAGVSFWKTATGFIPKAGTKHARVPKEVEADASGSSQGTFGGPKSVEEVQAAQTPWRDLPQRLAEAQRILQASPRRGYAAAAYFSGSEMLEVMLEELAMAKSSIDGMQLIIDHTSGVTTLIAQIFSGVTLRLLLDKGNFHCSSCARQADRVKDIWQAMTRAKRGEIRIMSGRTTGGFAMMHAKSWIIDQRVCLLGSVNLTHNGLENNTENLLRVTEPNCIRDASKDFEARWKEADIVNDASIKKMSENDAAKKEKAEAKRRAKEEDRRSRSQSRPRSPSRTLAPQFASVVEEVDQ